MLCSLYLCGMKARNKNLLSVLLSAAAGTALGWLLFSEKGQKIQGQGKNKIKEWLKSFKTE